MRLAFYFILGFYLNLKYFGVKSISIAEQPKLHSLENITDLNVHLYMKDRPIFFCTISCALATL